MGLDSVRDLTETVKNVVVTEPIRPPDDLDLEPWKNHRQLFTTNC